MGREIYQSHMEQRLRDLGFQIDSVKVRLAESHAPEVMVDLAGQLAELDERRRRVREKLDALEHEPDGTWEDLKAEIEDEWDTLVQDFEERVANLA
jgi:DNA-binding transcriptional MerR regulator